MIHLPKVFRRLEAQSGICHQQQATGLLDIPRLANGHSDYWISPSPAKKELNKKLILADWSAITWTKEKVANVRRMLEQLLTPGLSGADEAFEIYLWQSGKLVPLTKDKLSSLEDSEVCQAMMPDHLDAITHAAFTQYSFTKDDIHVLDDYWINHLLREEDTLKQRELSVHEFYQIDVDRRGDVLTILGQSKPPLERVVLDEFSKEMVYLYTKTELPPGALSPPMYRYVVLESEEIRALEEEKPITLSGITLELSELVNTEDLSLCGASMTTECLKKLLNAASKLKKLSLSSVDESILFIAENLRWIEEISISWSNITIASLESLLSGARRLKILDLSGCDCLSSPIKIKAGNLSCLEHLNLTMSSISATSLQTILMAAPHLKTLNLSSCANLQSGTIDLAPGSLEQLEEIDFGGGHFAIHILEMLGDAAHHIKKLNLAGCTNLGNDFSSVYLQNLEELDLRDTNITINDLRNFIFYMPSLKKIHLSGTHNIPQDVIDRWRVNKGIQLITPDKNGISRVPPIVSAHPKKPAPAEEIPIDPTHDAKEYKDYRPSTEADHSFEYKGTNKTKNQGMIIEKLSQYLTLTKEHIALIPKIREGICYYLAQYFIKVAAKRQQLVDDALEFDGDLMEYFIGKQDDWDLFMLQLLKWDGKIESLTAELKTHFEELISAIEKQKFVASPQKYLGDSLASFCDASSHPFILQNPWHAIAIQPPAPETDTWIVYDPNFVNGPRSVNKKELLASIHSALGSCVSVVSDDPTLLSKIVNPAQFIREGGLIALCENGNTGTMFDELKSVGHLTREDFDGLFLRNLLGIPAWVLGMKTPKTVEFTNALLQQFIFDNPRDYAKLLHDSMAAMSLLHRQELITRIIQFEAAASDKHSVEHLKLLVEVIRTAPETVDYEHALQTWIKETSLTRTVAEYCQQCVAPNEVKNRLIECTSTQDVNALHFALQAYCLDTHRPIFYVNSPDDLICSSPAVYRAEGDKGELRRGGGPLYDFLRAPREAGSPSPILLVNYDKFDADDIVRFNSLLDKERKADGEPVPLDMKVIGLINTTKPDCYQGSDFYSRFHVAETCPIKSRELQRAIPVVPMTTSAGYIINLFHAPDWKEQLLGRWVLDKDVLVYQEGLLHKALSEGATTFEIQNGLWENEDFLRLWQEATQSGDIEYAGRKINLPRDFKIVRHDGYDWPSLKPALRYEKTLSKAPHDVLNPTTLGQFFSRYQVTTEGQLTHLNGCIQAARGKVLHVHVTRALSENEWARLLAECKLHDVTLAVYGVELPTVLQSEASIGSKPSDKTPEFPATKVIQSNDVDTTVEIMTKDTDDSIVIDVSECSGADLLEKITGGLNRDSLRFEFSKIECEVTRALKTGKRVILKGRFSAELADELAPLLLERQVAEAPGTLVLISDNTKLFHFASPISHSVSMDEKKACLGEMSSAIAILLARFLPYESLSQLKSRRDFLTLHPGRSSDAAWAGMRELREGVVKLKAFDATTSETEAAAFSKLRKQTINQVLERSPYVFISGLSGVGKSTFVERELCDKDDILFKGESALLKWATEGKKKRKLLFLDEATLSKHQWSDFEGLFATPPGILINGTFHRLTPEHKVIFAGNPVNYGDERTLGSLFQRHGNAVVFQTLPTAVLYERILKPVFAGTPLETKADVISAHLLKVYGHVCACSQTEVLISPRELQMMALMIVSYYKHQTTPPDLVKVAKHFAYELAKQLVPEADRDEFNRVFQPKTPLTQAPAIDAGTPDFIITASRTPVSHLIAELLSLRELRKTPSINEAICYGGLGGIIIEGESGMGKSEMALATLIAHGYKEMHDFSAAATSDKPFYRLPVSLSIDEKTNLLVKAFNEGAVVIIDEINCSPMMERLLNELLMGMHDGKRPEKPGFMIIGTQNPVTMAGRRAPSSALSRRLIAVELPPYSAEEMQVILVKKGLSRDVALELVNAYQKQAATAQNEHLTPAPTFRDVIKFADATLKAHEAAAESATIYGVSRHSFFAPAKGEAKVEGITSDTVAKPGG